MPYIEAITKAGETIEIERYFSSRYKKQGIKRSDKVKPTKAEQKKVNTRIAEKKLRRLINANYGYGDWHINMGYIRKTGITPRSKEEMQRDIEVLLRGLRSEYKKAGLILKYIHVMEIGEKGARHHHLIINRGIDCKKIQECWNKAYTEKSTIHFTPLDNSGNYAKLANYLIKYTDKTVGTENALQGKRWNCSKNLVRPEPQIKIISNREWYRAEPKELKGYYVDKDSVVSGVHSPEYYGYGFFRYTLVKHGKTKGG